ncbi:hypothetical protein CSE16_13885 [Solibacillus sp. R5-41]|uniref:site-specific integrase n=1 Tax=Solibacillus sp. R5-41 TaxID=2048654 RepID=UPI000C125973|nr:site-specific integrase [Solibacillus sp. R5-41]ATP41052.1 hypothetical protein CSE16_13885 [Solibacillus sp. R5-41]
MNDGALSILNHEEFDEYTLEVTEKTLKKWENASKYNRCNINEDIWEIFCEENNLIITFNFSKVSTNYSTSLIFNYDGNLKLLLKCWVASNLSLYSLRNIDRSLYVLCDYIEKSLYLNKLNTESLSLLFKKFSDNKQKTIAISIINFGFYVEDLLKVEVINYFSKLSFKYNDNVRLLPSTKFLLIFHNKIKEFEGIMKKKPVRVQILHYLIKIWWELSMFVPILPIEAAKLKYKDITKENNKIYLKIKRNKAYNKRVNITKVVIPENLYKTIRKYYRESREYGSSITLFSRKSLPIIGKRNQRLPEYFNRGNLDYALKKYISIVFNSQELENYKEDIKLFTPIVTRHLAIINLVRQGYNSHEIAELSGHTSIFTQNHYSSHIENLIDLDLINIFNAFKYDSDYNVHTLFRTFKKRIVADNELNEKKHDVLIGFCTEDEMKCPVKSCFDCDFWKITKNDVLVYKEVLTEHRNKKMDEIKLVFFEIISLFNMIQNFKTMVEVEKPLDNDLKIKAKKLESLMLQYKNFEQFFCLEVIENGEK